MSFDVAKFCRSQGLPEDAPFDRVLEHVVGNAALTHEMDRLTIAAYESGLGCSHDLAQLQGENLRLRIALGVLCRAVRREWQPLECSGALFSALGAAEHVLGPEADL